MKKYLLVVVIFFGVFLPLKYSQATSCVPIPVSASFLKATDVFLGIVKNQPLKHHTQLVMEVKTTKVYKGDLQTGQIVTVKEKNVFGSGLNYEKPIIFFTEKKGNDYVTHVCSHTAALENFTQRNILFLNLVASLNSVSSGFLATLFYLNFMLLPIGFIVGVILILVALIYRLIFFKNKNFHYKKISNISVIIAFICIVFIFVFNYLFM